LARNGSHSRGKVAALARTLHSRTVVKEDALVMIGALEDTEQQLAITNLGRDERARVSIFGGGSRTPIGRIRNAQQAVTARGT